MRAGTLGSQWEVTVRTRQFKNGYRQHRSGRVPHDGSRVDGKAQESGEDDDIGSTLNGPTWAPRASTLTRDTYRKYQTIRQGCGSGSGPFW